MISLTTALRNIALIIPIGAGLVLLLRPPGELVREVREWGDHVRIERSVRRHWDQLAAAPLNSDASHQTRTIVVFTDYECEACRSAHDTVKAFQNKHPDVVLIVRHLPTSSHLMAEQAARAAICAEQEGEFERFHSGLMERESWLDGPQWLNEATSARVKDSARFLECLSDPATSGRIHQERQLAIVVGIRATPSYVSPQGVVVGIPTLRALEELVR